MKLARIGCLTALLLMTQPAWADSIQVTFTGQIYFTFDQAFGGPSFYGIQNGNSFSSVLTYDPSQPNLGTVPNQGLFGEYDYTVTVQTTGGPVMLGGPISWPCVGCAFNPIQVFDDFSDEFGVVDHVGNTGSNVSFVFGDYTHSALSGDALADVDWQNLLTLSSQPQPVVRAPTGALVAGGSVHDMFLRAPNAAVVVVGRINTVDVQTIPSPPTPIPEPATLTLLGFGIALLRLRRVKFP